MAEDVEATKEEAEKKQDGKEIGYGSSNGIFQVTPGMDTIQTQQFLPPPGTIVQTQVPGGGGGQCPPQQCHGTFSEQTATVATPSIKAVATR